MFDIPTSPWLLYSGNALKIMYNMYMCVLAELWHCCKCFVFFHSSVRKYEVSVFVSWKLRMPQTNDLYRLIFQRIFNFFKLKCIHIEPICVCWWIFSSPASKMYKYMQLSMNCHRANIHILMFVSYASHSFTKTLSSKLVMRGGDQWSSQITTTITFCPARSELCQVVEHIGASGSDLQNKSSADNWEIYTEAFSLISVLRKYCITEL